MKGGKNVLRSVVAREHSMGIGGSSKQELSNETGLVESVLVEPEILTEE